MRGVLITGNLVFAPANRRIDTDRFAAGHAGRSSSQAGSTLSWAQALVDPCKAEEQNTLSRRLTWQA